MSRSIYSPTHGEARLQEPHAEVTEEAFEGIFLAHYEVVFRLLYRLTGTREEAEDLAQEVFLRLLRAPQLRGLAGQEPNVRGWLCRVAVNLAYNSTRDESRRLRRQVAAASDPSAGRNSEADPAEAVLRKDERSMVRQALGGLPERQAALLLLRHAGLSYRELAEVLGVAATSVGTLLARAEAAFAAAYAVEITPAQRSAQSQAHSGGDET